ncbi:CaiB/BaiF CoA transferase family protein [Roseivirga sp. BDSF3-8]|uniref:CaiB/BaiF CoA transferase family protein n=1 Tax=Roseivirga sp. BDSF3-8 TaxID=3241598 RepID=UPI003531EA22
MANFSDSLQGYRVLELASVLAGPAVGQFFAECGAEVIKVESLPAGGDMTRQWKLPAEDTGDDRSAYFSSINWGKKSIAIDLKQAKGRDIIYRLVQCSDIVLSSYTDATAARLGMGYETLREHKPGIIFGRITGFGDAGEGRPAFDALVQAEAGFMYMNGQPGGPSTKMPVALMDVLAAHQLKEALLLAVLQKERTGEGGQVEVSLVDAAVSSLVNQAANWLVAGHVPQKEGSRHPNIAPYGDTFTTADGKEVILAVGTDRQFGSLCEVLGLHFLPQSPLFTTNTLRVRHREELLAELMPAIGRCEGEDLLNRLTAARVPAGIVRDMPDVMQTYGKKLLLETTPGEKKGLTGVPHFIATSGKSATDLENISHIAPPPSLGAHTKDVLLDSLGFSSEEVRTLFDEKVIK